MKGRYGVMSSQEKITYKPYKKSYDYSYTLGAFPTLELINSRKNNIKCIYVHSKYEGSVDIDKVCKDKNIEIRYSDKAINSIYGYTGTGLELKPKTISLGTTAQVYDLVIFINENRFEEWKTVVNHAMFPIVAGSILAYLLNPMLNFFERVMFRPLAGKLFKKNEKRQKTFSRACGITCTLIVFFVVLVGGDYFTASPAAFLAWISFRASL